MNEEPQLSLVLIRRLADDSVEWIPIQIPHEMAADPDADYALVDRAQFEAPEDLVARRQGDDLVVDVQGREVLALRGFFATEDVAFHPTTDIAAGEGPFTRTPVTAETQVLAGSTGQVVWSAEPVAQEQVASAAEEDAEEAPQQGTGGGGSPLLWGGLAAGGLGLADAAGGGGGGGGGDDSPAPPPASPEPVTVEGRVVAGPVIEGNGLSVDVFQADGTTQLGTGQVAADGSFSVDIGEYAGPIVVRVVDADSGPDYADEATGENQDLDAALGAVADVGGSGSVVSVNLNALTTLGAALAEREADGNAPTPEQVVAANAAIAGLFGLSDLHAISVVPVNGGAYEAGDGISAGERYGALLAAFSGATLLNGGDGQQTIDDVLAGITVSDDGVATLSEAAQALLLAGAQAAESATGESLSDVVATALDTVPPEITSGDTAPGIAENTGAGQVVYTATASDASIVTWSIAQDGDAAAFSINAETGAVVLTENPDFESQSSYQFTVVATDAAGNSSERTVTLEIVDQDDSVPFITSGATATPVDENSGDDQLVYTATATDDGTVTWSLEEGGDADAFSIDPGTGAVTLRDDPDHEEQSSYTFTVVASDDDGNSSRQTVTLAINDLDEVAPDITSPATATAIEEESGAGQVVYTVTSTDDGDISTGSTTYSLAPGGDAAAFTIDAQSGEVTLVANPDFETQSSYEFTVVATDAAGNSSEQTVTLPVTEIDDVAPVITSGAAAEAVDENSGAGQTVYLAEADDVNPVTWSLAAGGDAADFSIDATTGAVTLEPDPDFETKSSYTFTVVATDSSGNSSEQTVSLAIDNVDEVAPTITSPTTADAIDENSGEGQLVYTVTSTDDGDISTGSTTYSLRSGPDSNRFEIDAETGQVFLRDNPDFESQSSYTFSVIATDAAGNSSEQTVTLAVNDIADEEPPTLSSSTPADGATDVPVGGNIVLTFSETVQAGSGNILISDGTDTRTIDVTDTTQVTISGNQVTVDPEADLEPGRTYNVQIETGALTDEAGNPFAGITNTTTLDFETEPDVSVVVFDLVEGVSSDHSGRTFDPDISYDIYIRVDSGDASLETDGGWGAWSGAANLGSDDRVILVGDGDPVEGPAGGVDRVSLAASAVAWQTALAFRFNAALLQDSSFQRITGFDDDERDSIQLFDAAPPSAFFGGQGGQLATMYLTNMPAGILTSQGLV